MVSLRMFFAMFLSGKSHSHICYQLARTMDSERCPVDLIAPSGEYDLLNTTCCNFTFSKLTARLAYRFLGDQYLRKKAQVTFVNRIKPGDIAYPWPCHNADLAQQLANRDVMVVAEMINSHVAYAGEVLTPEYERYGIESPYGYSPGIQSEILRLELANFIFSPSPFVTKSLLQNSVPQEKIIESSYGFCPNRVPIHSPKFPRDSKPVEFLFVGLVGIRKGVPRLLEYWQKAQLTNARLTIVGQIDERLPPRYRQMLNSETVRWLPFTNDIKSIYREADVFVFPSLEEGSPLVTYEAMASGLPCLVSKAGAGPIVRHDIDGYIEDFDDEEKWITRLHDLACNADLRSRFAESAVARVKDFSWDKVGESRRDALLTRYQLWSST